MRAVAPRCALFAGADRRHRELDLATTRPPRRHDSTAATPRLTAATARGHQQQTAIMQLISTLALATSAAALVAPAAPKASTKLDVATLKNPSSTEFAYGLPGNEIPGVPSSRFDFDPLGFAERASPAEMVKYREAELEARPRRDARHHGHALRRSVAPDALRAVECAGDLRVRTQRPEDVASMAWC